VQINFANPQEHVPEAERNNRVIKERLRATYHRLPYTRLSRTLLKVMVSEAAKTNFFLAKNGVSKFYSPRMILHHSNLDYAKHCQYAMGTYVQAQHEPDDKSTNSQRTLDCIYLRYNDDMQGGHIILHLPTNAVIECRRIITVPITPSIIQYVHRISETEDMPNRLKLHNSQGVLFYDAAWISGMDYDEEAFDHDVDAT
jgi:hypothetical protein